MSQTKEIESWLAQKGFTIQEDSIAHPLNLVKWIAYRKFDAQSPVRPCSEDERRIQLILKPYQYYHKALSEPTSLNFDLSITGNLAGNWYTVSCYGISWQNLQENLDTLERKLIAAWNAIGEDHETTNTQETDQKAEEGPERT